MALVENTVRTQNPRNRTPQMQQDGPLDRRGGNGRIDYVLNWTSRLVQGHGISEVYFWPLPPAATSQGLGIGDAFSWVITGFTHLCTLALIGCCHDTARKQKRTHNCCVGLGRPMLRDTRCNKLGRMAGHTCSKTKSRRSGAFTFGMECFLFSFFENFELHPQTLQVV